MSTWILLTALSGSVTEAASTTKMFASNDLVTQTVRGVCASFKQPGECKTGPGELPVALVAYDPQVFRERVASMGTAEVMAAVPGDSDCYILKKSLQKDYCIEGMPLDYSAAMKTQLATNPKLRGRYKYLANITHGTSGTWSLPSRCAKAVETYCAPKLREGIVNQTLINNCLSHAPGAELLKSECPCYQEYQARSTAQSQRVDAAIKELSIETATQLARDQKTADSIYQGCKNAPDHAAFYSEEQDPASFAAAAAPGATIYSVSCSTAEGKREPKRFRNRMCEGAPDGLTFNMAKSETMSACVVSPEYGKIILNLAITDRCAENKCTPEEAKKALAQVAEKSNEEPYVLQETEGNFVCYACRDGIARKANCKNFEFPQHTITRSRPRRNQSSPPPPPPLQYHQ